MNPIGEHLVLHVYVRFKSVCFAAIEKDQDQML